MGLSQSVDKFEHHNILTQKQLEERLAKEVKLSTAQRRARYTCGKNYIPHTSLRPFDIDNVPAKFQLQTMLEKEYILDAQIDRIRQLLPKYLRDIAEKLRAALFDFASMENADEIMRHLFRETYAKESLMRYRSDLLNTNLQKPEDVQQLIELLRQRIQLFDDLSLFCAYKLSRYRVHVAVPYLIQELYDGLQITLLYQWALNDVIHPRCLLAKYGVNGDIMITNDDANDNDDVQPKQQQQQQQQKKSLTNATSTPATTTTTTTKSKNVQPINGTGNSTIPNVVTYGFANKNIKLTSQEQTLYEKKLLENNIPSITQPTFAFISRIFYNDSAHDGTQLIYDCVELIIEIYRKSQNTRILTLGKSYCLLRSAGWSVNTAVSLYLKDLVMYEKIAPVLVEKYHSKFPNDLAVKFVKDCLRRTDFVFNEAVELYDREIERRTRAAITLRQMLKQRGQNNVNMITDRALILLLEQCHWDYNISCERFDSRVLIKWDQDCEYEYQQRIKQQQQQQKEKEEQEKDKQQQNEQKDNNTNKNKVIIEKDQWEGLDRWEDNIITDYYNTFQLLTQNKKDELYLIEVQRVLSSFLMVQITKKRMNNEYGVLLDWDTRNIPLSSDHWFFKKNEEKNNTPTNNMNVVNINEKNTKLDPSHDLYALQMLFQPHDPNDYVMVRNIVPDLLENWSPEIHKELLQIEKNKIKNNNNNQQQQQYDLLTDQSVLSEAEGVQYNGNNNKKQQKQQQQKQQQVEKTITNTNNNNIPSYLQFIKSDSTTTNSDNNVNLKEREEKLLILKKSSLFNINKLIPYEANTEITKLFCLTGNKPITKNHPLNSDKLYTKALSPNIEVDLTILWCRLDRTYPKSHQLFRENAGKWYEQDYFSRFVNKNPKIGDVIITPGYNSCSRFIIHVMVPEFFVDFQQVIDCINIALLTIKNFSTLIDGNMPGNNNQNNNQSNQNKVTNESNKSENEKNNKNQQQQQQNQQVVATQPQSNNIIAKTIQFTSLHDVVEGIPIFFSTHILLASIRRYLDIVANRRSIDKMIVTIDDNEIYHIALRCACLYFPPPKYDSISISLLFQNIFNKSKFGVYYNEVIPYVYPTIDTDVIVDTNDNDNKNNEMQKNKQQQQQQQQNVSENDVDNVDEEEEDDAGVIADDDGDDDDSSDNDNDEQDEESKYQQEEEEKEEQKSNNNTKKANKKNNINTIGTKKQQQQNLTNKTTSSTTTKTQKTKMSPSTTKSTTKTTTKNNNNKDTKQQQQQQPALYDNDDELMDYYYQQQQKHQKQNKNQKTNFGKGDDDNNIIIIPKSKTDIHDKSAQQFNTLQHQRYIRKITSYDDIQDQTIVKTYHDKVKALAGYIEYY